MVAWIRRFLAWGVILAVLAGGGWAASHLGTATSAFKIRSVVIEPPLEFLRRENIPMKVGDPLFGFTARTVEQTLLGRYPQLQNVKLSRSLEGTVTVHLTPRIALGRIAQGTGWTAVDRSGHSFQAPGVDLPKLDKEVAMDARALETVDQLRTLRSHWFGDVDRVMRTRSGMLQFFLKDRTEIFWGSADDGPLELKSRRLERVLSDRSLSPGGFEYLHFVEAGRIVAKKKRSSEGMHGES